MTYNTIRRPYHMHLSMQNNSTVIPHHMCNHDLYHPTFGRLSCCFPHLLLKQAENKYVRCIINKLILTANCQFLAKIWRIHNLLNGTILIFSAAHRHPVAIVGETHSAGTVCSSQLNYLNIAKTKHTSTFCCQQMHEQIYTWVLLWSFCCQKF